MGDETDDRPLVRDLLEKNASKLEKLRSVLEKEDGYSAERYDDLWMLRFLLTHKGKVSKASDAAVRTIAFRKQHKLNELGDIRHKLVDHMDPQSERHFEHSRKYLSFCKTNTAVMYAQPDPDRGLIQILCPLEIDVAGQMEGMTRDEMFDVFVYTMEIIYQIHDEVTRRTGRLTSLLRIVDAEGIALSDFNADAMKRDASIGRELADFYPQLLGKVVISGMGSWFTAIWKVIKQLAPKRFVEKVAFVKSGGSSKDAREFLRYITKEDLWERFGGDNLDWPVARPVHLWENK